MTSIDRMQGPQGVQRSPRTRRGNTAPATPRRTVVQLSPAARAAQARGQDQRLAARDLHAIEALEDIAEQALEAQAAERQAYTQAAASAAEATRDLQQAAFDAFDASADLTDPKGRRPHVLPERPLQTIASVEPVPPRTEAVTVADAYGDPESLIQALRAEREERPSLQARVHKLARALAAYQKP